jgi:hypothetical protein
LAQQHFLDDQTGLNGLAQTHFVGQQHSGGVAACHLMGNV